MNNKLTNIKYKIADIVVKGRWIFFGIFIAAAIACVCLIPLINIEYDLSTFLADGSDTSIAMDVMKSEFDDKGMCYVLIKDIDETEVSTIAEEMSKISGIKLVAYSDTAGNISYKNRCALYTVTFTSYDASKECFQTVEDIRSYIDSIGKDGALTGQSAYSYYTNLETNESMLTVGIIIGVVVLLMLLFTSKSFFEIIVMIIVFGISISLNIGTNAAFPSISYVSNLISLVLQLALSIDYSVIMLHRFMEEYEISNDSKVAAKEALVKAFPEILSSSLTTIVGLCALMLMSLQIGVEIGISLAKSIVCSLLPVLFFMPALLTICAKPLQKTKHKSFVPNIVKPAKSVYKARKIIVPIFLIIIILSCVGQTFNTYAFNMNGGAKITSDKNEIINAGFGTNNTLVVIVPKGDYEKERELVSFINSIELIDSSTALSTIEIQPGVYLTSSYDKEGFKAILSSMSQGTAFESMVNTFAGAVFDGYISYNELDSNSKVELVDILCYLVESEEYSSLLPQEYKAMMSQLVEAKSQMQSEHYSRLMFNINCGVEDQATFDLLNDLKKEIKNYYNEFYLAGESSVCLDMAEAFPKDNMLVSIFTVVFILVILLFTFKNFALPFILTLAIEGGIWINFVIPFLSSTPVSFVGYLIIMAIQMGATIDYAIVLTNRYITTKDNYIDRYDCMAESLNAVFPTIITSGIILTVTGFAMAGLSSGVVSAMGLLLGIGTLLSMLIVIFIVPSLLLVTEKLYTKLSFKRKEK